MMKPALSFRPTKQPKSWQNLPNGEEVLFEINKCLAPWWPRFFGYYMLKIGNLSVDIATQGSAIKRQITISQYRDDCQIVANTDELPFIKHAVDVCVLAHALEFTSDPHHLVREASRVLIPNGYLVITGYNPFSLAGLNCFLPYRKNNSPWNERFFSPMRVKDWLHLLGFEILEDKRFLHASTAGELGHSLFARKWQQLAGYLVPSLGSIYVIVAKKREWPLTPIKSKVRLRSSFSPVKVSTMSPPSCRNKNR